MAHSDPDPSVRNRAMQNFMDAAGGGRGAASWRSQAEPKEDPWGDDATSKAPKVDSTSDQEHEEILRRLRQQEGSPQASAADDEDLAQLTADNSELRSIYEELRQLTEETAGQDSVNYEEKEREFEALLEEKTEAIRMLHMRIQELERVVGHAQSSRRPAIKLPSKEELLGLSDELDRERCQMEQERRQLEVDRKQLQDDEEAMVRQMREMELQMAKERAELARQRNELTRLHSEIKHELERAQRDRDIHKKLESFRRNTPDSDAKKKSSGEIPAKGGKKEKDKDEGGGGMFGRWFGKK